MSRTTGSPRRWAPGASGWEVWLDGLEITQYTYFQQAGGYPLDPVPIEYTYGLERIVMYLQGVKEVWQIDWDGRRTYGDVLRLPEIEHCKYDFEIADVARLKAMYDLFEAEAKNCLAHRLVIPAHDYVLRCSHTFNLLDARGAIGVTERAYYFARMRDLARQVSIAYVEQREQEEYPWLADTETGAGAGTQATRRSRRVAPSPGRRVATPICSKSARRSCPGHDLVDAINQLKVAVPKLLGDLRLAHGEVTVTGTPRRLVVLVKELAPMPGGRGDRGQGPAGRSCVRRQRRGHAGGRRALRASTGCPWRRWRCGRKAPRATSTRSCAARAGRRSRCCPMRWPGWLPGSRSARRCAGMRPVWPSRGRSAGSSRCSAKRSSRSSMPG